MSATSALPPVERRRAAQAQVRATRAAIGDSWAEFEPAALRVEGLAVTTVRWARRAATLAAMVGTWRTLRRLPQAGPAGTAARALAIGRLVLEALRRVPQAGPLLQAASGGTAVRVLAMARMVLEALRSLRR